MSAKRGHLPPVFPSNGPVGENVWKAYNEGLTLGFLRFSDTVLERFSVCGIREISNKN